MAPDLLPPGSVRIGRVWIDDAEHTDFDADALTVQLPESDHDLRVKVRLVPAGDPFDMTTAVEGEVATLTLTGNLDVAAIPPFERDLQKVVAARPTTLVLDVTGLNDISPAGMRGIALAQSKLGMDLVIKLVRPNDRVRAAFANAEMGEEVVEEDAPSGDAEGGS